MKKLILSLGILGMFLSFGAVTHADVICGNPADNTLTTQYTSCDNGSPENVVSPWGFTNSQLPHIKPGQTKVLLNGQTATCPWWYPMYCVDISGTSYYIGRYYR